MTSSTATKLSAHIVAAVCGTRWTTGMDQTTASQPARENSIAKSPEKSMPTSRAPGWRYAISDIIAVATHTLARAAITSSRLR